ncbi:MAG: Uncharacterised protein [Gammaproteobacteria bacterium]|nr:MAG: Uncharacterised protein [Gammaproteobacteria bacterium]|tara:strand:+ start:405 stop:812 length:408 start_codon:yes stop_codon:yes gene_type:complete
MDNYSFWYPALLFPAIPLMLIVYSNKYTALATLIRKLHILAKEQNSVCTLSSERIKILDSRLVLLRWMQTTACLGFIANLMTIFLRYFELYASSLAFFGLSVVLMIISILLYVIETQQSHLALSNHVSELKNIQE